MKMKEVCEQTKLTERAVRFYVQEMLVTPQAQRRGGRTWLDFSKEDVERLRTVATLRKAGFTLDEIRGMLSDFSIQAPKASFALRQRLLEATEQYEKLCQADPGAAGSAEELASRLRGTVNSTPLPAADKAPRRRFWFPWEDALEWICMFLAVLIAWKLYLPVIGRPLDELLFSIGASVASIFLLPVIFIAGIFPVSLVLGSKLGKWLVQHLDFDR